MCLLFLHLFFQGIRRISRRTTDCCWTRRMTEEYPRNENSACFSVCSVFIHICKPLYILGRHSVVVGQITTRSRYKRLFVSFNSLIGFVDCTQWFWAFSFLDMHTWIWNIRLQTAVHCQIWYSWGYRDEDRSGSKDTGNEDLHAFCSKYCACEPTIPLGHDDHKLVAGRSPWELSHNITGNKL